MAQDESRLVYGYRNGVRLGPWRAAAAIALAQGLDRGLGHLGLVRPVLLVSGFWRSGTTWLQESLAAALGAKTVFEPLSPMEPHRRAALAALYPADGEDLLQATIPGPAPDHDALWGWLGATAEGRFSSPYLMSCRRGPAESLCRTAVIKDVRLHANLGGFHRRFGLPVAHVRRHPCGVVASLLAADWHWSFARAPLAVLLPRLGAALTSAQHEAALRFDTDAPSRIAALWALAEGLAAAGLEDQRWGATVSYERLAENPAPVVAELCRALGLRVRGAVDFSLPSASVAPAVFGAAATPGRWRQRLPAPVIARVERVADALFPAWRAGA